MTATINGAPSAGVAPQLASGEVFGPYRIDRLLGSGGMGEVYEAEHLGHERRVALKLLNRRLADAVDRARFLREGELAASVTHPNSVYIFGSEEIAGVPVITMELLGGGTLKDRVEADGPLAPRTAVDVILQLIAGLDAAFQAGVLHRDVKPSNCFLDIDGTVKIGDFGLSISTIRRFDGAVTEAGEIRATPQFASPEQLTGRPLDVRADIYAVGATLYYLLTGKAPFSGDNLGALLARVLTEPVPSLKAGHGDVPVGLDRIIARCLAKDPAARPDSYAALDQALRPFSSAAAMPAPLPVRFAAGAIDHALLIFAGSALILVFGRPRFGAQLTGLLLALVYYSALEGLSGASVGKRICGLRVTWTTGVEAPGIARAFGRAMVYTAAWHVPLLEPVAERYLHPSWSPLLATLLILVSYALAGALFATSRRSNHFAAVHDLLTSTRVVMLRRRAPDHEIEVDEPLSGPLLSGVTFGPYRALYERPTSTGRLFLGHDDRLKRRVWIHTLPPGAPAVPVARRRLLRPGRLRWLGGARGPETSWDAYEAPSGHPFAQVAARAERWRVVKHRLTGLAREIEAALQDGTLPPLSLDRVWITRHGTPVLFDFPLRDEPAAEVGADGLSAQQFMFEVARRSLVRAGSESRVTPPVPHAVQVALTRLGKGEFREFHEARLALEEASARPDSVSRRRRAASCLLPGLPLTITASTIAGVLVIFQTMNGGPADVGHWLDQRAALEMRTDAAAVTRKEALDIYLVGLYAHELRSDTFWSSTTGRYRQWFRPSVQRILADRPSVSSAELGHATAYLQPEIEQRSLKSFARILDPTLFTRPLLMAWCVFAVFAMVSSLVTRGGLVLWLWGIAVVTPDGVRASRLRALGRTVVTWLPLLAAAAVVVGTRMRPAAEAWFTSAAVALFIGGALYAIARPERGLQDVASGTWLVPR